VLYKSRLIIEEMDWILENTLKMKAEDRKSDIENLLQSQKWKTKRLPSLYQCPKVKKQDSQLGKIISRTEQAHLEPLKSVPCISSEFQSNQTTPETMPSRSPLCSLAVPFDVLSKAVSAIQFRQARVEYQIPVFPKTEFGKSTKGLEIQPKFEQIGNISTKSKIRNLKLAGGRIKVNQSTKNCMKLEILADFNRLAAERTKNKLKRICLEN
jgi:hypothetical protein